MNHQNILIGSKSFSLAGTVFFNVCINLWVINTYGSTAELGKIMAIAGVSNLLFGLLGGYIGDILKKENILRIADLFSGLICLISFFIFSNINIFAVSIIVFLLNMNSSLSSPIIRALVPQIVQKTELIIFNSKLSGLTETIKVGMPVVTTYLYGQGMIEIKYVFLINGISFFISYFLITLIRLPNNLNTKKNTNTSFIAVLKLLKDNKILLLLMITSTFSNFIFAGMNLLLPTYSISILESNRYYGYFLAAEALGSLLGIYSSKFLHIDKNMLKERIGLFFSGFLACLPFIFNSGLLVILFCFSICFFLSRYNVAIQSYLQTNVPNGLVGKTFAISYVFAGIAVPLGSLFFGFLGEFFLKEIFLIISFGIVSINGFWILYMYKFKDLSNHMEI
jgi:hypothetical protein